ncbi:MAG: beta-ketoacyl-[acyl-carrier-protein] synthase family protein [Phycisphaerae bacterium]
MKGERRVVITGLGVACPLGIGVASFWDALMDGRNAVAPIRAFDASTLPSSIGAEMPAFSIGDYIPKNYRKSVKLMSRDIQLAVVAACEAARDAKLPTRCLVDRGEAATWDRLSSLSFGELDPARVGANIGAGLICPDLDELGAAFATAANHQGEFDLTIWGDEGMGSLTPLWLLKFLPNMLACHVSIIHDTQAMSNTITCGEASSHLAIGEAFRNIARGGMDACICGGTECKMNPMGVARPALMNRLVVDGASEPTAACRPFSARRNGTVASEGGSLLILESLEHAKARGARIYAEVVGFGASGNTHSWDRPDPTGGCIAAAVRKALADADVRPERLDLVTVFGCGTVDHDASELRAWKSVLGDAMAEMPALAIKGGLGNNGAGSGALDVCATVLAIHYNTIPPSLNTDPPDPEGTFRFAAADPVDCRIDTAITLGYALGGGQNAALVIKKFRE